VALYFVMSRVTLSIVVSCYTHTHTHISVVVAAI
jgi:hypothetical protein